MKDGQLFDNGETWNTGLVENVCEVNSGTCLSAWRTTFSPAQRISVIEGSNGKAHLHNDFSDYWFLKNEKIFFFLLLLNFSKFLVIIYLKIITACQLSSGKKIAVGGIYEAPTGAVYACTNTASGNVMKPIGILQRSK